MYSIIAIILLIIILVEFYSAFKNSRTTITNKSTHYENKNKNEKNNENENEKNNENENESNKKMPVKYNKFSVKGDKLINHFAGYIYLKENYNFFIKEKNKTTMAKKNKIYKIDTDFTVEVLDVNGKTTFYYYIKSQ